jgi:hypothetical protein
MPAEKATFVNKSAHNSDRTFQNTAAFSKEVVFSDGTNVNITDSSHWSEK